MQVRFNFLEGLAEWKPSMRKSKATTVDDTERIPSARETSRMAREKVVGTPEQLTDKQTKVMELFRQAGRTGLTDEELTIQAAQAHGWGVATSTARTRRSELAGMKHLEAIGTRPMRNGNKARVWALSTDSPDNCHNSEG